MADTQNTSIPGTQYACFISYTYAGDNPDWARWIQEELESYRTPPSLVGQPNRAGDPIPEKIFPVFRDETSASGTHNLTQELMTALDNTRYLIVICSPEAVESRWVSEEVAYFKSKVSSERVFGICVSGNPGAGAGEPGDCQPKAFREKVDPQGQPIGEMADPPLMPDFRVHGTDNGFTSAKAYETHLKADGYKPEAAREKADAYSARLENMKLKLIAGLLNVPLDQLTEREFAHQEKLRRDSEREASVTFATFLLAPFFIALSWVAMMYLWHLRVIDVDLEAHAIRIGDMVYMQAIMDTLGSAYVAVAGLLAFATIRLRNHFSLRQLVMAVSVFAILTLAANVALGLMSQDMVRRANYIDELAAREEYHVDPGVPNLRRMFDQYRLDGSEYSEACSNHTEDCERGPIVNAWLKRSAWFFFYPPITLISIMFIGVLLMRMRKEKGSLAAWFRRR